MAAKHTLGPWAVTCERDRENAFNNIGAPEQAWPESEIALVPCDNPNYRANQALIAAAPDLLEALKEWVARREREAAAMPTPRNMDGSDGRYARARAAIAKATGGEP